MLIIQFSKYYTNASNKVKQKIISSIFPQKLIFEGKHYRTYGINQFFEVLMRFTKEEKNRLNENPQETFEDSTLVARRRIELLLQR